LALLDDDLLQLLDHPLDLPQVGIDGEGPLEVHEGLFRLVELYVDLPVARQHAPVLRVALDHLVAVLKRPVVLPDEEVHGRPLVPAFRELGLAADDLAEGGDGGLRLAVVHLLHPHREQLIHDGVARAAPDLPNGVLGEGAHEVVGIAEEPEDGGKVVRGADLSHPDGSASSRLRVGSGELAERFLAREGLAALGNGGRGAPPDPQLRAPPSRSALTSVRSWRGTSPRRAWRRRGAGRRPPWSPPPPPPRRSPSSSRRSQ